MKLTEYILEAQREKLAMWSFRCIICDKESADTLLATYDESKLPTDIMSQISDLLKRDSKNGRIARQIQEATVFTTNRNFAKVSYGDIIELPLKRETDGEEYLLAIVTSKRVNYDKNIPAYGIDDKSHSPLKQAFIVDDFIDASAGPDAVFSKMNIMNTKRVLKDLKRFSLTMLE